MRGPAYRSARLWLVVASLLGLLAVPVILSFAQDAPAARSSTQHVTEISAELLPAAPSGANRCVFCHPAEVEGYQRTTMAHSLRRAGQEAEGIVDAHGSKITAHSTSAGYSQRWENGGESKDYPIDYVIGSGTHAAGYLANLGGHLFQSPIAFYTTRRSYDLAPGFENVADPDFTRPVSEECVLCHSGTALHISGTLNAYRAPFFAAEAITCERCHGPAEKHLADPRPGTIINPVKLEPAVRDSVCEQCHLFGVARVPNPGKRLSDFVPGQRLEDTFTIYRNVVPANSSGGSFKVISHVEQLALSLCARHSAGRLWCGTCHDPHNKPLQPAQYYRTRCLSCHTSKFAAAHPDKDSDCLACHMPRRNAQDGGHTVFTDHRIQRRPATETELPPDTTIAAWREPAAELERRNFGIALIDVGLQRHSSAFIIQGYRALAEVQRQFSNDSEVFKWIGDALLAGGQTRDATFAFERALQLDPSPLTEAGAASPYLQRGDAERAMEHLQRAVSLDPLYLAADSTLIDLYRKAGRSDEAAALAARIDAALKEGPTPDPLVSSSPSGDSAPLAEQSFKNLQVLKAIPAAQLLPTMEFISSALGVRCKFCHVEDHFEKDDKKPKQTARKMMEMTLGLNKNSFGNLRAVTCYSCHRGAPHPSATPEAGEDGGFNQPATGSSESPGLSEGVPTASQLLENYISALGGASSLERISSRAAYGTATVGGKPLRVEILTQSAQKYAFVLHSEDGPFGTLFDGADQSAWRLAPGHPRQQLTGSDRENARMDADLQFSLHVRQFYPDLRVQYSEKIAGRPAFTLYAFRENRPVAKFYFDQHSGLLVRLVRYAASSLGDNPSQTDYGDYRELDGVEVPFRLTLSSPQESAAIQLESVRQNVAIDPGKFLKPAASRY